MIDQHAAFLSAIIAAPEDDTPRLIYADWLDEHDDPRGEFIRVQVELATCDRLEIDLYNEDADWSECTGIAACWCPNCGDCCCREPEESMSDEDCPLHGSGSRHCCLDSLHYRTERLRSRERELWVPQNAPPGYPATWFSIPEWACYADRCQMRIVWTPPGNAQIAGTVRRGFISHVTLTLADWCGRECSRCRNGLLPSVDGDFNYCEYCHATGGTDALGPQIVACCPLERVTLSDLEAWNFGGTDRQRGWWLGGGPQVHNRASVPLAIWEHLAAPQRLFGAKAYPDEAVALDALSAALIAYAKTVPSLGYMVGGGN